MVVGAVLEKVGVATAKKNVHNKPSAATPDTDAKEAEEAEQLCPPPMKTTKQNKRPSGVDHPIGEPVKKSL